MRCLIIGNGAAGIAAAESLRAKDVSAEITIITDEPYLHYSRPRVIEYLAGKIRAEEIVVKKQEWYDANRIGLKLSCKVERIEVPSKTVLTSSGEALTYDRLVIAAGASSFIPPVPGSGLPGVFSLRTIDDAKKIISFASGKKEALLIGGGLLGLESGMSLKELGLKVTIVEFFDRLLPRQLDVEGAALLRSMLEAKGLSFLLPRKTLEIKQAGGQLEVVFEGAQGAIADMVLFSAGIRPNLKIVEGTGIETGKGIKVNSSMETNIPGIYAAGDITEFNGMNYGIWPAAKEQGAVAGGGGTYAGSVLSTKLKVAGIELASAGDIEEKPGDGVVRKNREGYYAKAITRGGKLAGLIMLGDTKEYVKAQKLIKSGDDAGVFMDEFKKS